MRFAEGVVPAGRRGPEPPARPAMREPGRTPNATGLSAREAVALFGKLGISVHLEGTGFVVAQDPPAGAPIAGRAVHLLTLSDSGPAAARFGRGREETPSPPVP